MRQLHRLTLAAALCPILLPSISLAQYENGSIVGTVHDATGAVVSNATVTVTNSATGIVSTRTSSDSGAFEVPALRVGQYNVAITKEGFATANATNISVTIGGRQRVDLALSVGNTATTIDVVSGVNLQVEADNSQRGQIVTQYQTSSLPLVSRNYTDLLALSTGVRASANGLTTTATTSLVREGSYNVNGQRSIFNNFLLDGMDNNAYGESNQGFSNQIINPPPDSIAQFQVVTNNQSAEYGRASGATFNVAYKSGANQFHGVAYDFLRNTALNAFGYFRPAVPVKPQFIRNQFGGNFSGPILHDRLFFFLDYEGFRQVRKQVTTASLPSAGQRNGVFATTVYDPFDGTPYAAGRSILTSPNISPIARQVLGLLPANTANTAINNYTTLQRSQNFSDKGTIRLDFQADPRDAFFVRVSDLKQNATDFPLFGPIIDGSTNGKQRILDQQVAVGWTRILGANQLLDARLGLSRTKAGKFSLSIGQNPGFILPGLPTDPLVAGGIPSTSISGGFSTLGRQATNPQFQNPALLNPKVNYSWVLGRHSLKTGYEYQHVWMAVQDTNPLYGSFNFAGAFSRQVNPTTGALVGTATPDNYVADFLFGASNQYSLSSYFVAHLRNQSNFAYVQDDWKVTPKLTLNLGVRYEYTTPYYEQKNQQTNFNPALANSADPRTAMVPVGAGKYGYSPDKNDFAPRLGFAFAPDDKTSLRGGYGISFAHYNRAGSGDILAINAPQALFVTQNQAPQRVGGASTYRRLDTGFPATLPFVPTTDNITYINSDHFRDSYVHSYYLALQRQLAKNTLVDVAYVGNYGLKLLQFANFNQSQLVNGRLVRPIPTYGDITLALHSAYSHYDSLQVRYEQRMVAGLTLLNSFTYSHTLDNAGASLEANTPSPQDYYNLRADYANSEYNQPLVNTTSLVYELPFGRGKRFLDTGGIVNQALGGWQLSAVNQAQSGLQFNLTYSPLAVNQVSGIQSSFRGSNLYRPNMVHGQRLTTLASPAANRTATTSLQYVNLAALQLPASGSAGNVRLPFGTLSRDAGRSPNINYLNLAANKRFQTPIESLKVEFRSEFYNLLNHTNFTPPGTGITGGISATSNTTPASGGAITTTFDPRIIQFGLKALF